MALWSAGVEAAAASPSSCLAALTADAPAGGVGGCGGCQGAGGEGGGLLGALLLYAEPGHAVAPLVGQLAGLAPEHRARLRREAWSALLRAAPLAPGAFLSGGGDGGGAAALVRSLIAVAAAGGAAAAHGSLLCGPRAAARPWSREGTNAVGPELPARLVARLCQSGAPGGGAQAAAALMQAGAVPALLALLPQQDGAACAGDAPLDADVARTAALSALAVLCEAGGPDCCTAVRRAKGAAVLVKELDRWAYLTRVGRALKGVQRQCMHVGQQYVV
jgi:hypothetical protein